MAASASADTVLADLRGHKFATEESLGDEMEAAAEMEKAYVRFRDLRKTSLYAIFKSNEEEQRENQFNISPRSWNMDYLKVKFDIESSEARPFYIEYSQTLRRLRRLVFCEAASRQEAGFARKVLYVARCARGAYPNCLKHPHP